MNISTTFYLVFYLQCVFLVTAALTTWTDDMIPYFIKEPVSMVTTMDASLTLPCLVHPPSAEVRWKFDGDFVDVDNSFGFTFQGADLHIPKFKLGRAASDGNEGTYQCTAKTQHGSIFSKEARISKAVLKKFEGRGDLYLNITEGSNLVLPCQPPESVPKAQILYRFNDTIINETTDHYRILPSGNLLITEVTVADQGQYQCMAHNTIRNRTRTSKHVIHLYVLNTVVPSKEPSIIMPTTKVKTTVGDDVVLECSAVGNPQPIITWERYGGKLPEGRYVVEYGNLFLRNVSVEDDGTYLCKAENGMKTVILNGLKALMLEVIEQPKVESIQSVINTSVGNAEELKCLVAGRPPPQVTWLHNGRQVTKQGSNDDNTYSLSLSNLRPQDRGLYQCFVENDAGTAYATILVQMADADIADSTTEEEEISKAKKNRRRKKPRKNQMNGKAKNKKKQPKGKISSKLVPPDKPEVKQLSDTSVMLNWTVPENEGLTITFFRVQYKEVAPEKGNWKTEDEEVKGHLRMDEVKGLKSGGTYKFRIAAVYSNNDNMHGPNSDRFVMKVDPQPEPKRPGTPPTIVEVKPIDFEGSHGLYLKWQHNSISTSPIEGFYILYKPYSVSEPFKNITLLHSEVRGHLLRHLDPNTAYLVKMQSFNSAGKSPFSNEAVEYTNSPDGRNPLPKAPTSAPDPIVTTKPTETYDDVPKKTSTQSNSEMLYMVLGIVLGVMMLLLIVFMFMCWWKQRQQRRMMAAMNDAVRNKFQDPSHRIYADSMRKKFMNGGFVLNGVNGGVSNGQVPRHKMNINVNPLSEVDSVTSNDGSNNLMPTTFHPNGTLPGQHRASDNNCNNINRSKSLENSIQHSNQLLSSPSDSCGGDGGDDSVTIGNGGEMLTSSPAPPALIPNGVGHMGCDSHERCSNSNQSCDQVTGSHDQSVRSCDSSLSYDDTGGIQNGRHRKRRRRSHNRDQPTKDQATNTDLSSNEGTMDFSSYNKASSSSQESDQCIGSAPRTYPNCEPKMYDFSPTAAGV